MRNLNLGSRIAIAVVLGICFLRTIFHGVTGELGPGDKIYGLFVFVSYGIILHGLFGFSILNSLGEKFGAFYLPKDDQFRIMPQYSKAEARVKEGKFAEAIAEYRLVSEQFPEDIFTHVQIAMIATDKLHDLDLAETELLAATSKANSPDAIVMSHNRLSDFYQFQKSDLPKALQAIEQIQVKLPGAQADRRAMDRIVALQKIMAGATPSKPPTVIHFRKANRDKPANDENQTPC